MILKYGIATSSVMTLLYISVLISVLLQEFVSAIKF